MLSTSSFFDPADLGNQGYGGANSSHTADFDFSPFFHLSLDFLCVLGFDGYLKRLNPTWQSVLGFTSQELMARPWAEFLHPEDLEVTMALLQKMVPKIVRPLLKRKLGADDGVVFEARYRCRDGMYRWLRWNAIAVPKHKCFYLMARDITERKLAKQALWDSEERVRCLVDSIKDYAIYMLDLEGHIISWNQGVERISGYSEEEVIGQHVSIFYTPEDVQAGKPARELLLAAELGRYEDESQRLRKDGSLFWVNAVVTALQDEEGNLRGFAKVTQDITARKQVELDLQTAYEELEIRVAERTAALSRSNELLRQEICDRQQTEEALHKAAAKLNQRTRQLETTLNQLRNTQTHLIQSEKMSALGQLVAGVAHEINNPVNFIYGNLSYASQYIEDLLGLIAAYQTHYPNPPAAILEQIEAIELDFLLVDLPKLLNSMKIGADRIHQIVLSLRNFSRLDEADMKPVDIHEGIDNTLLILHNRIKPRPDHVAIEVMRDYGHLPKVVCYAGQLNQVFMNILSNAIDALEEFYGASDTNASGPKPTIRICTRVEDGQWVKIAIADNGPGIPEDVQHRLFEPFFTTKPIGKGTGLGLSISYQVVVEKHQGRLQCLSTLGQGTEFLITIPLVQQ